MTLPSLDNPPIVIRESRWKAGLVAAGAALMLGAVLQDGPGRQQGAGYIAAAVVGAIELWALAQLVRPSRLTLDESGFRVDQFWRSWSVGWAQVSNFRLVQGYRSITRYVAYDYIGDRLSWSERPSQLPAYWTMSPPELRDLMARCKDHWGSGDPNRFQPPTSEPTVALATAAPEAPYPREPTVN